MSKWLFNHIFPHYIALTYFLFVYSWHYLFTLFVPTKANSDSESAGDILRPQGHTEDDGVCQKEDARGGIERRTEDKKKTRGKYSLAKSSWHCHLSLLRRTWSGTDIICGQRVFLYFSWGKKCVFIRLYVSSYCTNLNTQLISIKNWIQLAEELPVLDHQWWQMCMRICLSALQIHYSTSLWNKSTYNPSNTFRPMYKKRNMDNNYCS